MYVSALRASGYRNLEGTFPICAPLAILVGENNAGKSNVIDALRTVLEPEAGPRSRHWLREGDFKHNGLGERVVDELELEVQLSSLDLAAQSRMVTCRAGSADAADTARIRLHATIGPDDRIRTQWIGGDSEAGEPEAHAREAVRFVYLHPLRDAANDLRPGRDNKLVSLISALAPPGDPDRDLIVAAAVQANKALDTIQTIKDARGHVATRLGAMTGGGRFAQRSGLAFADPKFERVIGTLRAKIGQLAALEMEENGLGYNNLLYMAVLLAAIADAPQDPEPTLRVLLVEEPEAHLHPQLQELLMHFLQSEAAGATQVIVTTHSPNFASSADVERLTVLARPSDDELPQARVPRDFGLDDAQLKHLRRFLDVTKAALFFARGVILVEGLAEQLLIPVIAEHLGRPLAPNGVSVINVDGVAFPPFTDLFGPDKLPYRLAVISDGDRQTPEGGEDPDDPEDPPASSLSPRAARLAERTSDNVFVSLAHRTLEWDLAKAGNTKLMFAALTRLRPTAGPKLEQELAGADPAVVADRLLKYLTKYKLKGRFAQELADLIDDGKYGLIVPDYLREAIEWVADAVDESGS
jgi:putative ATP-dependent endonuclease of OLD family